MNTIKRPNTGPAYDPRHLHFVRDSGARRADFGEFAPHIPNPSPLVWGAVVVLAVVVGAVKYFGVI